MPRSIPSRPAPLALSLSLFASFSAPALAADPVEQQMVVIGSRAPTSISELPGTVWVIEREQLDQQTQAGVPLKEALGQLIPGLDIGSQGRTNNGQNLRGRSVLVMIDGVSLNSSRGISRQFDSIDPFNIERIEVMSGASAVYGGGATGGIINIVTKKLSLIHISEPPRQAENSDSVFCLKKKKQANKQQQKKKTQRNKGTRERQATK